MEPNFPDTTEKPRGFGGTEDPSEENADGSVNATEQEQMQYDLLTVRARKMMFGKAKDNILEMLGSSESPAQAIGQAGAMIMKSLLQAAKQNGMVIANDVAIEAGTEIADDLNELGKHAGVFKYDDQESENAEMEDAMLWGVKYFGEGMVADGEISPEMQKSAQAETASGLESEGGPKRKADPIGDAVSQASQPAPQAPQAAPPQGGLVGGQMPPMGGV
jgi:hypothetical protein